MVTVAENQSYMLAKGRESWYFSISAIRSSNVRV